MSGEDLISRIAEIAEAVGWQAGVGGMETAGAIVSYLAKHPEKIADFERIGFDALPVDMHLQGRLTWHAMNGTICSPEKGRRARIIRRMERQQPHP